MQQLREAKVPYDKACSKVDELLANQEFLKVYKKRPETVGSYFKKNKARCQKKYLNT